ncbi:type VI secretion system protein TssA [Photobacterium indicum]|uniref:type VI secretion system protein TssA n=1 Tax=Photobacterium indicum TaxID=81447 RepID=UPI003D0F1714
MQMKAYRERMIKPISDENPVGDRLFDDALFDFVETQMMKVGSLAHADVQWAEVERSALILLEQKTKDLKILTHLLQCLQHQSSPERFTLSVYLLTDFMNAFWETCYPAPGPRGSLPRRKFFTQIAQRMLKAAENLDETMFDVEQKRELEKAVEEWQKATEKCELPIEPVDDLQTVLCRKLSSAYVSSQQVTVSSSVPSSTIASPAPKLDIDGSSERAIKQTLLKVADFLSELDNGLVHSLRLRRFAVWLSVTSTPDADGNGQTQLMPVSKDRVREYEEQLQRGADLALWRKVEQSLTLAPFWLDGHYLSSTIALKLGKKVLANAIREEVVVLVERLPSLLAMSFKGGMPFADKETQRWLTEGQESTGRVAMTGSWDDKRNEAMLLAKEGGLSVALVMLNDGLQTAKEPRDSFYWRLLSADVMHDHQLNAMASQQYETLKNQAQSLSVTDWEPSLIQRLENVTEAK